MHKMIQAAITLDLQWTRSWRCADLYTFKKVLQIVAQLLAQLLQVGVLGQVELVLQPSLPIEIHPAVHPPIGL